MRLHHALAGAACAAALLAPTGAAALPRPDAAAVLNRACAGRPEQALSRANIAEALLIEAGISPTGFVRGAAIPASATSLAEANDAALVAGIKALLAGPPSPEKSAINAGVMHLEMRLNREPESVTVERPDGQPLELFGEEQPTWRIVCERPDPERSIEAAPAPPPRFAIRETPEELWLGGRAARKAGAFSLGFERTRTELDNGTRNTETSFTVDGTAGFRLTAPTNVRFHTYLFATYNLQRDRTRPPPTLGPGESESDGDTNVLALGLDGRYSGCLGTCAQGLPLAFNFQAGTIFDFANDASRLRLRAIATPRREMHLKLCRLGAFSDDVLRARCEFSAEIQAAQVLRRGTTALGNHDNYLAIGGRASIELFLPTGGGEDAGSGFLASARYRLLAMVHGPADDIERFEAKIAHRFWTSADVGIDVGFTYTNGTNELSFEEEDILTFGLGLIF